MSGAVSAPSHPETPSPAQPAPIFRAFIERRVSPHLRWFLVAVPVVAAGGLWALTRAHADLAQVITPRGIVTVRRGMSPEQVKGILGKPLTVHRGADGLTECYRHGQPTLGTPTFRVYSACYEEGELRSVTVKHFEAWGMDTAVPVPATANTQGPL